MMMFKYASIRKTSVFLYRRGTEDVPRLRRIPPDRDRWLIVIKRECIHPQGSTVKKWAKSISVLFCLQPGAVRAIPAMTREGKCAIIYGSSLSSFKRYKACFASLKFRTWRERHSRGRILWFELWLLRHQACYHLRCRSNIVYAV